MSRQLLEFSWEAEEIKKRFEKKSILITGGTGSLGNVLTEELLRNAPSVKIIIFSRDEFKQALMRKKFCSSEKLVVEDDASLRDQNRISFMLGDVRDASRLKECMRGVDFVIHTAALKHVDGIEYNPEEAIKTIVMGGLNVIQAAEYCNVKRVVALSTDKACTPVNLYGAAKLCSDKLFVAANANSPGTIFSVVRYGNVFTSRGSVVPYFVDLIEKGATILPVTDDRMTRFSISLQKACAIVFNALLWSTGGELFVPRLPSYRITDLVEAFGLPFTCVGIRPGEKLHEEMVPSADARNVLEFDDHFVLTPNFPWFKGHSALQLLGGRPVHSDFSYVSNQNDFLTPEQLKIQLEAYKENGKEF